MQKTNTAVEIRNSVGRLVAKYYPDKGVIEICQKGCYSLIIIPPGTPVQFGAEEIPSAK